MDLERLRHQIKLAVLRQQTARLAVRLFELANNRTEIDEISKWVEYSNRATSEAEIHAANHELAKLLHAKNPPFNT